MPRAKEEGSDKLKKPFKKTVCPITREEFHQHASPMPLVLGSLARNAMQREFNPKEGKKPSFGWYLNDKVAYIINGKEVKVQVNLNMTIIGSNEAPDK